MVRALPIMVFVLIVTGSAGAGVENCPADGDCLRPHTTPGCDCAFCCETVCAIDPSCCADAWDAMCVELAFDNLCDKACLVIPNCPAETGDCCAAHESPGCDDEGCCYFVCFTSPFCCEISWDPACVDLANQLCEACPPPPGPTGDLNGDGVVDGADLGLLLGSWGPCAPGAPAGLCPGDGGDCCVPNGTPGCDDLACCEQICAIDAFCCNTAWDALCADEAGRLCATCGGVPCPADLNGDGVVDGADLGLLLGNWTV